MVTVSLATVLGLLAVALTGSELTLERVRGCVQSGGIVMAVGMVALLAAFVVSFSGITVRRAKSSSTRQR